MLKDLKRRALRGLLDKLLDQPVERRPLAVQPERSRDLSAHTAH
ncbi:hypothetical protein [Pseudomonas sp. EpS/L25]|nr:hypothetical protein [Pseudomonas sp. EpS/L25]